MGAVLPPVEHGAVLAGIKAIPCGWPAASLDPACGRRPPVATGSTAEGQRSDKFRSPVSGDRPAPFRLNLLRLHLMYESYVRCNFRHSQYTLRWTWFAWAKVGPLEPEGCV